MQLSCHNRIPFVFEISQNWTLLAASTLLSHFGQIEAATINAKSGSLVDVSSAVASAKDGDTVTVPAGTAIWTSTLNIAKNITLQGAGVASTIIIDDVP